VLLGDIGLFKANDVSANSAMVYADSVSFGAFDRGTENPFSSRDTSDQEFVFSSSESCSTNQPHSTFTHDGYGYSEERV